MKNISHFINIFVLLSLFAVGCAKEDVLDGTESPEKNSHQLVASLEGMPAQTRAAIVEIPKVQMEFKWNGEDRIGVSGKNNKNVPFSIDANSISENGKEVVFESVAEVPPGKLTALFPYQDQAVLEDGKIKAAFPAVQQQDPDGFPAVDASCNLMLGKGTRNSGVKFYNLMSILKIGQSFDQTTLLKRIEFRDLSGHPVCGEITASWEKDGPHVEVTGDGKVLSLDFGEGMEVGAGCFRYFFMIVPSGEYPKGFEIAFVDNSGERVVKTVGTKMGKKLIRNTYYSVGEEPRKPLPDPNDKMVLNEGVKEIVPELSDLITVIGKEETILKDKNGKEIFNRSGFNVLSTEYLVEMHEDMNPAVGDLLIFNHYIPDLPNGMVYRIATCEKMDGKDFYRVKMVQEANPAAPFKEVSVGSEMWDADGNLIENAGVDIDVASYVTEVVVENGESVPFTKTSDGALLFEGEAAKSLLGKEATKWNMSTPKLTHNFGNDNCDLILGVKLSFNCKCALGIMDGNFQYVHFTLTPQIELSFDTAIRAEMDFSLMELESVKFKTAPIPIPGTPIVMNPEFSFKYGLDFSFGGEISASASVKHEIGTMGVSYNVGNGLTYRNKLNDFKVPDVNVSTDIKAYTTISSTCSILSGLCFYGSFTMGMQTDFTLSLELSDRRLGRFIALTPEIKIYPYAEIFTEELFEDADFEDLNLTLIFDPLWERCIIPKFHGHLVPDLEKTKKGYIFHIDGESFMVRIPYQCNGYDYSVSYPDLGCPLYEDLVVAMEIYQGSSIKYYAAGGWDTWWNLTMGQVRSHGLEHLYGSDGTTYDPVTEFKEPKLIHTEKIAVLNAADSTFSQGGVIGYDFRNNIPYGAKIVVYFPSQPNSRFPISTFWYDDPLWCDDNGKSGMHPIEGVAYQAFIIYWPNRANGQPYE